nr:serine/threonine-protein kinase [Caldilineaceae bacterium]
MALPLKQIGPFQGQEPLVPGAEMGVYRVTDTRTQHDCVLYVLDLHLQHDPVLLQRFRQTAHQTSPLRHEHLVPIVETGEAAHYAYAATGPLSGITLADYLQRHTNPLTIAEAIDLVQQIAAGLDAGHQQGLLHLALTPSEIWMSTEGQVQVMGLGVPRPARPVGEQAATDAESAGVAPAPSPFLAPEQARGAEQIDQRADVYSLGAIAYLLLVGQPPIQTDDPLLLARQIVYQSPTPPESLRPDLPPGMVSVLKFVLTKDPNLRYGGAGEFAGALLQAQRGQAGVPVTATPGQPPWRQQALDAVRLWPAHRRLLVASLLLILLLVALLLAWRPFGRVLSERTASADNQLGRP